ncbi:hypothetical protein [Variovorax ginsengisoli]|uniref:Uncharacterized protein n=1 Tax=Variovorax ginsengisoli TaxID=363844 RepID=A0ABT8S5G5_9BURK|nr:hypothetical protein [Variovorax ginsengisoli]MDN8614880.1 hypothetical protein [Variovorax ginsengisoli]MDO1534050.1 hypothetical protein [Variovorax ginsengisoli]
MRKRGFAYLSAEYHEAWQDAETRQSHGCVLLAAGLTTRPVIKRLDLGSNQGSTDRRPAGQ